MGSDGPVHTGARAEQGRGNVRWCPASRTQQDDRCSRLILSGHRLDYIAWGQLTFRENSGAFRLTLRENRLGFHEKSLITSDTAGIL